MRGIGKPYDARFRIYARHRPGFVQVLPSTTLTLPLDVSFISLLCQLRHWSGDTLQCWFQ